MMTISPGLPNRLESEPYVQVKVKYALRNAIFGQLVRHLKPSPEADGTQ